MDKYRRWTAAFCLLMSASLLIGQAAKTVFVYAPLTGWLLGGVFGLLAIVMAIKAYRRDQS